MILGALLVGTWAGLVACSPSPLDRYAEALGSWEAARRAADAGDWTEALGHLDRALAADPDSPALVAWKAHVQRRSGDEAGALATLEAGLRRHPRDRVLRYDRAALLARSGAILDAARELAALTDEGLIEPGAAGLDPDFAALAADPRTRALVPPPVVRAEAAPPDAKVLLGDTWVVSLEIRSPRGQSLSLSGAAPPGLALVRLVEDVVSGDDGVFERRRLETSWRALAPGAHAVGPWTVAAPDSRATVGPWTVEVVALGEAAGEPPPPWAGWFLPSRDLGGVEAPWAGPLGDRFVAAWKPGQRGSWTGAAPAGAVAWEWRRDGQVRLQGLLAPRPAALEIRDGGRVVARWP